MLAPVSYSPVRGEERGEVQRETVPRGCFLVATVNTLAVFAIGIVGAVYWTMCMGMAPPNAWYNQDIGDMYQSDDKAYWCTHYNSWYHKNNLTRCVEALQHAEKAQAQCWDLGGRVFGLVMLGIFAVVVGINAGYFCAKKVINGY